MSAKPELIDRVRELSPGQRVLVLYSGGRDSTCLLDVAVALVRPTKSIHDVDVRAVKKKMKDKAFARAVNRDDIVRGAEALGMPLDDVIANVVAALKADALRLGLAGAGC